MIRVALVEGRIGNPVPLERPGTHGHPVGYLVRDTEERELEAEGGRFLLPEGGLRRGDVLVFARAHATGAFRVAELEEHLVVLEPITVQTLVMAAAPTAPQPGARTTQAIARAHVNAIKGPREARVGEVVGSPVLETPAAAGKPKESPTGKGR